MADNYSVEGDDRENMRLAMSGDPTSFIEAIGLGLWEQAANVGPEMIGGPMLLQGMKRLMPEFAESAVNSMKSALLRYAIKKRGADGVRQMRQLASKGGYNSFFPEMGEEWMTELLVMPHEKLREDEGVILNFFRAVKDQDPEAFATAANTLAIQGMSIGFLGSAINVTGLATGPIRRVKRDLRTLQKIGVIDKDNELKTEKDIVKAQKQAMTYLDQLAAKKEGETRANIQEEITAVAETIEDELKDNPPPPITPEETVVVAESQAKRVSNAAARLESEHGIKAKPRAVEEGNAVEEDIDGYMQSRGVTYSFVDSDDPTFTGVWDQDSDSILVRGGRSADSLWETIGHEMAHADGRDIDLQLPAELVDEAGKRRYRAASARMKKRLDSDPILMQRESKATVIGRFFREKSFRRKMRRTHKAASERLVDAIRTATGTWTPQSKAEAAILDSIRGTKSKVSPPTAPVATVDTQIAPKSDIETPKGITDPEIQVEPSPRWGAEGWETVPDEWGGVHREQVKRALLAGLPVPKEVLAGYPGLVAEVNALEKRDRELKAAETLPSVGRPDILRIQKSVRAAKKRGSSLQAREDRYSKFAGHVSKMLDKAINKVLFRPPTHEAPSMNEVAAHLDAAGPALAPLARVIRQLPNWVTLQNMHLSASSKAMGKDPESIGYVAYGKKSGQYAMVHELGHYVYDSIPTNVREKLDQVLEEYNLSKIYQGKSAKLRGYIDNYVAEHPGATARELFAEAFSVWAGPSTGIDNWQVQANTSILPVPSKVQGIVDEIMGGSVKQGDVLPPDAPLLEEKHVGRSGSYRGVRYRQMRHNEGFPYQDHPQIRSKYWFTEEDGPEVGLTGSHFKTLREMKEFIDEKIEAGEGPDAPLLEEQGPVPEDFEDSKVRETVYHGSARNDITTFFTDQAEPRGHYAYDGTLGAFFTEDPASAYDFSGASLNRGRKVPPYPNATLYEAKLRLRNPLDLDNLSEKQIQEIDDEFRSVWDEDFREVWPGDPGFKEKVDELVRKGSDGKEPGDMFRLLNFFAEAKPRSQEEIEHLTAKEVDGRRQLRSAGKERLRSLGYDGIIVNTAQDTLLGKKKQYIVFDAENIWITKKRPAKDAPLLEENPDPSILLEENYRTLDFDIGKAGILISRTRAAEDLEGDKEGRTHYDENAIDDPEAEKRYRVSARGVGKLSAITKWERWRKDWAKRLFRGSLPELPREKLFAMARALIPQYKHSNAQAIRAAENLIWYTVRKLNKKDFDLFSRKIQVDDLDPSDERFPWGLTKETMPAWKEKIDKLVAQNPRVAEAVKYRNTWLKLTVDKYIKAHQAIGIDLSSRFQRKNYYRHQVLYYMRLRELDEGKLSTDPGGRGRAGFKNYRGWAKQRQEGGSNLDINANYIEAEWETTTQIISDTKRAEALAGIQNEYNIIKDLKAQAKEKNFSNLVGGDENVQQIAQLRQWIDQTYEVPNDREIREARASWIEELKGLDPTYDAKVKMGRGYAILNEELGLPKGDRSITNAELDSFMGLPEDNKKRLGATMVRSGMAEQQSVTREVLGDRILDFRNFIPDGYSEYQLRQGRSLFGVFTLPQQVAEEFFANTGERLGIDPKKIKKALALGQEYTPIVIPTEVAAQLENIDELVEKSDQAFIDQHLIRMPMRLWKTYRLQGPLSFIPYNIRNFSEIDKVMFLNPRALRHIPRATRELWTYFRDPENAKPLMNIFMDLGAGDSTFLVNELANVSALGRLAKFAPDTDTNLQKAAKLPVKGFKAYWEKVGGFTQFRELILRYANFLEYMDQLASPEGLRNYGGSVHEEIDGISDNNLKAYRLSQEILGDYSDISVTGQWMRDHLIPFWSFQEVNFRAYYNGVRNIAHDPQMQRLAGTEWGKAIGSKAILGSAALTMKAGRMVLLFYGLKALLTALSRGMFPDADDEIGIESQRIPHLTLGWFGERPMYFSRLGTASDTLEWLGIDSLDYDMLDLLNGRRTLREVAADWAKGGTNKAINGLTPFIKVPMELVGGKSTYPDFYNRKPIFDGGLHIARALGMQREYKAIMGKPSKGFLYDVVTSPISTVMVNQSAYYAAKSYVRDWQRKVKGAGTGSFDSPKGRALREYKVALALRDHKAAKKYGNLYFSYPNSSMAGLRKSLESQEPLYGLSKADKKLFLASLRTDQRAQVNKAYVYYHEVLLGK